MAAFLPMRGIIGVVFLSCIGESRGNPGDLLAIDRSTPPVLYRRVTLIHAGK
jgi:hypothetical protein